MIVKPKGGYDALSAAMTIVNSGDARRSVPEDHKQDNRASVTAKPKVFVAAPMQDVLEEEEVADDHSCYFKCQFG